MNNLKIKHLIKNLEIRKEDLNVNSLIDKVLQNCQDCKMYKRVSPRSVAAHLLHEMLMTQ